MIRRMQNVLRHNEGFTLIDLGIAVAIIGILTAVSLPNILHRRDRARMAATVAQANSAREALAAAIRQNSRFPLTADIANDVTKLNSFRAAADGRNFTASTFKSITYVSADAKSYKLTVESIDGKKLCVTPGGIDRTGPCP